MTRAKGKGLSVKLIIFFLFLISPFPLTLSPVYAVDSTPSAIIQSKLNELKKEIASKAAALKQEVNRKLQNKAYAGIIKSASGSAILIIDKNGVKNIKVNQDTVFENQLSKKKALKFADLKEGQLVAGLGEIDELNNLIAKKIILIAPSNWEDAYKPKTVLWGKVISSDENILTIKDYQGKNNAVSIKDIDIPIKMNDFTIITGYLNKTSIINATFAYVIPQGGVLKPKKIATPSATPKTASPSATRKK